MGIPAASGRKKIVTFCRLSCSLFLVFWRKKCRSSPMSTSFPHGFHGFQGLPSRNTTNSATTANPRINNVNSRTDTDTSITYRPGGQSPVEISSSSAIAMNRDNDIECQDSQPTTCPVAVLASSILSGSNCSFSNHGRELPVSIAVPIYGNIQTSGM